MLVWRVEHLETGSGPFQSEFYLDDTKETVSPDDWGKYLPVWEDYDNDEWEHCFDTNMRRWACPDPCHIRAMGRREGKTLAEHGWTVKVYEVPDEYVFKGMSGKQVIIDFAHAILQATYDLIQFLIGKEVQYAA